MVIFNSFCFDITMYSLLYLFWSGVFLGVSCFIALGISSITKAFVEEHMLTFD